MSLLGKLISPIVCTQIGRVFRQKAKCPICMKICYWYGDVDFNKSCTELYGKFLPVAGFSIAYYRCACCGFCFAPDIAKWSHDKFSKLIYNDSYSVVDPDCVEARPRNNAEMLNEMFSQGGFPFRHLDYGGGDGLLSKTLRQNKWRSESYDPFVDNVASIDELGMFDLITAYEVFEHVPDPRDLMARISRLLKPDGVVLFSTLLSDGALGANGTLSWWYAAPRNGHISLFSRQSLGVLAKENGFCFGSFSEGFHCMWRTVPPWAGHIIPV